MTKLVDITPQIEMGEAILKKIEEMEKERDELKNELLTVITQYSFTHDEPAPAWIRNAKILLEKYK